jgi:hypothetical protein
MVETALGVYLSTKSGRRFVQIPQLLYLNNVIIIRDGERERRKIKSAQTYD